MPYLSPKPPGWGCGCCSTRNEPTPFLQILFTVQTPQESVPACKSPDCIGVFFQSWSHIPGIMAAVEFLWPSLTARRGSVCSSCQLRTKDWVLILGTGFQDISLWSLTRWNVYWCFSPLTVTYPEPTGCRLDYKYLGMISIIWDLLWVRRLSVELC